MQLGMQLGVEAARWMIGKALGPVSGGVLEAWAASTELGGNIEALRMELLYAEGMLNNARGHHGHGTEIKNPALSELLHKLRDLAYRADDALDEVDYFRLQDELEGTDDAAEEHDGGCLRYHALNARHAARAIAKMLGFSKCSGCFSNASHAEPDEDTKSTKRVLPCGGHWPCTGVKASDDDEEEEDDGIKASHDKEEEEDPRQGGVCWPCPCGSGTHQLVNNYCMGRITSAVRTTIHTVGKHIPLPCYSSVSSAHKAANPNAASTGRRFLCCACANNKAPKLKFDRVEISQEMKDITEQLKPLCAKVSTILNLELLAANLNNNNSQYMATSRRITISESIEPKIYGREGVTSKIVHDITKGKYHDVDLTVLPIVGPGGIGKTTLTQQIYKELKDHFEIKLWVCVSVNFNVSRLTQEIAEQIPTAGAGSPENRIKEGLKTKKFLLVLDDIWRCNEDEWNKFLLPFNKGQTKGSTILVTTRFPALAQMVKTSDKIDLEGIEKEPFKELFFTYVFGNKKPPEGHSELLGIGEDIIKKLKGSPLAAKTVGRLLRNHLDLGHWTRVLESKEWESQSGEHDIMPALKLSFDYLPFHLQQCFTYCSLFPEDYKFSEEEIIHFWIGLDVLHSRGENKKVEDIGLSYLTELFNHGFLKMEEYENGKRYYVIHDLMHELGLKVSEDECLSLYSSKLRSIQILPSIRHLSINIDDSSVNDSKAFKTCKDDFSVLGERLRVENLHSLMLFGKHQGSFAKTFHGLFSKAKALRVILVSGDFYSMEDLLHNFSELIHLRYLHVQSNWLYGQSNKLRASNNISRFYHMKVLDLRGCKDCHNLPRYMSNLLKLRHFLVQDVSVHSRISKVGNLKSLQGLHAFEVGKESQDFKLSQLGHLLDLCGSLQIDNWENIEGKEGADEAKLMHKKNLNELILNWNVEQPKDTACEEQVLEGLKPHSNLKKLSIRDHGGCTCPSWLGLNLSVQNLESLCLDAVDWEIFPHIGGKLQLVNRGAEEKPRNSPSQHLMNLKRIELCNLERLERWVVDSSSGQVLPHLEELFIQGCPELVELQLNIQQDQKTWPPTLQNLEIEDCPKLLSLPPVPWTCSPCFITLSGVGLGFESMSYGYGFIAPLNLEIIGNKETQDSASCWASLDFSHLTEVKELRMDACPPLPLEGLHKMSSLTDLNIANCINAFGRVEDPHVDYKFAVESMYISSVGAISGKKLTQILSYMPYLSELAIIGCGKITGSGVMEQQQEEAMASREEEEIEEADEGLLLLPPQLHELTITSCPELRLHLQTLPWSLRSLSIADCPKLTITSCPELRIHLQTLSCSLRSLRIINCPKFLNCYSSSSSRFPFPSSLQFLYLGGVETLPPLSNLASLATLELLGCGGDARGMGLGRLLAHGCLKELILLNNSTNFFNSGELSIPSSSTLLSSLRTDDVAGVLAAPICRLLSSSLTKLQLSGNEEMERFTEEQDEALQHLTSLQHLEFACLQKLQSLPARLHTLTSLNTLEIEFCPSIRLLPNDRLPNSLQNLTIFDCSAIRSLPKHWLPNSLQELHIKKCPSIRALPNAGLPTSLKLIDVSYYNNSDELKRQCRNLVGTIPIVKFD